MRDNWQIKKIGDVCIDFIVPQRDKPKVFGGDIPWCRIEDIQGKYLNGSLSGQKVTKSLAESMNMHICPKGTVICACSASIGNQAITTVDCYTNQTFIGIVPNPGIIFNEFLYYFFKSKKEELIQMGTGATIKYISRKKFENLEICFPSVKEQHRIVDELNLLADIIDKKNAQLLDLDALTKSIFYEMFGDPSESKYPVAKLSSLATGKLSYGSGASAIIFDGQTRYVRITDIQEDGRLSPDAMSPSQYDAKYLLNDGDILFARSGATVGKTYLYDSKDGNAIYAGYLIRLVPNQEIVLPEYIYHFTRSHYYRAFIASNVQAVAQPNINAQQYGNLSVCVPPISEQKVFAEEIHSLESKRDMIWSSIKDTQTLLDSRMSHYFG